DEMISLVRQIHLHQHIAGEELALGIDLATAAKFDNFLCRHQHFIEMLSKPVAFRLLTDRLRDLLFEVRIGVDDIPAFGHGAPQLPIPSTNPTPLLRAMSTRKKNIVAKATMTKTITVVMAVSRRVGQVTFRVSDRTSRKNSSGLVFAMISTKVL